ncbi:calpain-1 catalytic subunit-like isoform X2 [Panulirus ornatus]|uniref:calpain-1 catalytic subunit-like isoform X2 n=1 Tax=Panulirus ornatus TaxID=150431 RepID=UPI003A85019C
MPRTSNVLLYRGQDYAKLRARCWSEGRLFEDPEFPADDASLGFDKVVKWKRPNELVEEPRFIVDADRFSVVQGELGDCWFVSALSAVTLNPGLLYRVVPRGQDFSLKYVGIFHFRFWQGGQWIDVVVDDKLPVNPKDGQLCFSHSSIPHEFWSALLEKAYAKIHGSYGALNAGKSYEATEDLTGGVTERFLLQKEAPPGNLFSILVQASQRGSLITSSVSGRKEDEGERGLIPGHGYCVTWARRCRVNMPWRSHVELMRLRNPWGDEDFKRNFEVVYVTSLNPHSLNPEALEYLYSLEEVVRQVLLHPEQVRSPEVTKRKVWEVVKYDGSWVRNATAGGPPSDPKVFSTNPQYLLQLTEADDEDQQDDDEDDDPAAAAAAGGGGGSSGSCKVVISLTQKNRRVKGLDLLPVAICVYQVEEGERVPTPLSTSWLRVNRPMVLRNFARSRTVTHRLALRPGRYIAIPCTAMVDQEGDFLLRVFCEKTATMQENDEEAKLLRVTSEAEEEEDTTDGSLEYRRTSIHRGAFLSSAGEAGTVDAHRLQLLLNHLFTSEVDYSLELCRSLSAMMDHNLTGNIDFYEFDSLVESLRSWVAVYKRKRDPDTGLLSGRAWGLGDALRDLGYQVPRRLQGLVVVRYGDRDGNISLGDFLMAACRISIMLERFENYSCNEKGCASVNLSDWLQETIYC